MPLVAPTSVRFFKSESLDNARPQEPGTFCHQDPFLVLLCPLWPPPGLMPDRVWVSVKASEKARTTGSPATGKRSFPGETWSMPPAAREGALKAHPQQSGLFFSYGANFSPSGHLGTSPRDVFLSQLALKLVNLLPQIIRVHHYTWPVLLLREDKPQENPYLQGGEMSPARQSVPTLFNETWGRGSCGGQRRGTTFTDSEWLSLAL